jgi:hypothetical protein
MEKAAEWIVRRFAAPSIANGCGTRLGPEWKPDKAKFVVSILPNFPFLDIWVDPSAPNAWREPPYFAQITQWAVDGPAHGKFVLVRIGPRLIAVLPDREVDLGHVDSQAPLAVSRELGPTGVRYDVEVRLR